MFAKGKKINHEWIWQDLFQLSFQADFASSRFVHKLVRTDRTLQAPCIVLVEVN